MSEHTKYNLDDEMAALRTPIDARWSARKKRIVGAACVAGAAAAIGAGVWGATRYSAPSLPRTADEAIRVMASGRYDNLDAERKRQYAAEAQRLLWSLEAEERRRLMEDEKAREALRAMREEMFDDMARRFARGERPSFPQRGDGPPRRPPGEQGERRPPFAEMTDEERAAMMERMRAQANERMNEQVESGNAQSGGLRSEMMKRTIGRGGGRGGPGGGGRRGGGASPRG